MGSSNSIYVELDKGGLDQQSVYPGAEITGKLHLDFPDGVELGDRGISIKLVGKERAHYYVSTGRSMISYLNKREMFRQPSLRIDSLFDDSPEIRGHFAVPFRFTLPRLLTPSFCAEFQNGECFRAYAVRAKVHLKAKTKRNLKHKSEIFVAPTFECPRIQELLKPQHAEVSHEKVTTLMITRGEVSMEVDLPTHLVIDGETLRVHVRVDNQSGAQIDGFRVGLLRRIVCSFYGKPHEEKRVVSEVHCGPEVAANSKNDDIILEFPVALFSLQNPCDGPVIQCSYEVDVEACMHHASDVVVTAPVNVLPKGFKMPRDDCELELPPPPAFSAGTVHKKHSHHSELLGEAVLWEPRLMPGVSFDNALPAEAKPSLPHSQVDVLSA